MANTQPTGYYVNPVFSQQSEFLPQKRPQRALSPQRTNAPSPGRALSPGRDVRLSPLGAQQIFDNEENVDGPEILDVEEVEEQEFYEEVIVDDNGFIKGKKFVVVAQNIEGKKYIQLPQNETKKGGRYGTPHSVLTQSPPKTKQTQNQRYEYIPLQEQDCRQIVKNTSSKPGPRVHRYAVIEPEEETEICTTHDGKFALVPIEEFKKTRYEYIPDNQKPINPNRYEYISTSPVKNPPPQTQMRYESFQTTPSKQTTGSRYEYIQHSPKPGTNPYATQKLHEILSTPKKTRNTPQKAILSPNASRRVVTSPTLSPIVKDPFATPRSSPQKVSRQPSTRVQQKLNYAIGSKQLIAQQEKRSTAVVAPMCSSPIQSIYGETTYSSKSESWMNLSMKRTASGRALVIAGFMMFLCGSLTSGLCFYMISKMGRLYFLDFGTVAGFTCIILGLLGFRSRNVYWLPNRNYISGYLVLSLFSLIDCAALLVLLVQQPKPGTPLADMTSGAVCGISVLSLLLAATGVVSSYCCKYPPPDNRVEHCSPGLTV